ncbi:MAG TPA: hypothetical protein VGV93_11655 [Acidimicrobiales bacterium]|nr:hypothetical protein [Acidimicrobiales bacterium]
MNELTSGSTVLTLAGVAALLTAAALALERARVLPVPGSVLGWLGVAVMALGLIRVIHSDGSLIYTFPTMAAWGLSFVLFTLGDERHCRRPRRAEVFATIAPAIDGKVVARDRLEGRWSTYSVEVRLAPRKGMLLPTSEEHARHTVTLQVGSGGYEWCLRHGRRPAAWRSKEWYVTSSDPAVVESLESLGAPTLMAHRYCHVDQPFSAELEPPRVHYDPDRGRLSYVVVVAGGRMTSLTLEQFTAQLDLLGRLAELDRQANPPVR